MKKRIFIRVVFLLVCSIARSDTSFNLGEKMQAILAIVEWIEDPARGHNRLPLRQDITRERFPFHYEKLMGLGPYRPGGPAEKAAIFNSPDEFWLTLKAYAQAQGIPIRLTDLRLSSLSGPLASAMRDEAFHLIFKWTREHSNTPPTLLDFGTRPDQVGLTYERFISLASGKEFTSKETHLNQVQAAWLNLKAYAAQNQISFRLLDVAFKGAPLPALKRELQQEVHQLVFHWIQEHPGQTPLISDFSEGSGEIPVSFARVASRSLHSERSEVFLFQNAQEFWRAQKAYSQERGVQIHLMDIVFTEKLAPETKGILRAEALELVLDWIKKEGRLPRAEDFGRKSGQIPFSYKRLKKNSADDDTPLFESIHEFWQNEEIYARERGVEIRHLLEQNPNLKFKDVSERSKRHFKSERDRKRTETVNRILRWMLDPARKGRRIPKPEDFGFTPGQIPIDYGEMFQPSTPDQRPLFRDAQELWRSLKTNAAKRGVKLQLVYLRFPEPLTKATRRVIQLEALDIIIGWINDPAHGNGFKPGFKEFKDKGGSLPLSFDRLTGAGHYKSGGARHPWRIFDSHQAYQKALRERLREKADASACKSLMKEGV